MVASRSLDYLIDLVLGLCKHREETEWIEFKSNRAVPDEIGEYISALANSAALVGKSNAYMVWGVDNKSHELIGTDFDPISEKKGNEELENWLLGHLKPKVNFKFYSFAIQNKPIVLLEISASFGYPLSFNGQEFIRVGSYKKKLKDFPEKERALWRVFETTPFEKVVAMENVTSEEVLSLLDYPSYFSLLELPLPDGHTAILNALAQGELLSLGETGKWNITNLGAILLAKKLDAFHGLRRKAIRVIQYKGRGKLETLREQVGNKGYAAGFEGLIDFIMALIPRNEVIGKALRQELPMFPELAVRELVANALIHQDFSLTGSGPMVEIFEDRMEITNPGEPIVDTLRFIDTPPLSRNEALASAMRLFRICEERGSGIDKVVAQVELYQLPAPSFEVSQYFTKAVLFAYRPLNEMDKTDRVRACYLHACLKWVMRDYLTNSSLRERFGIEGKNMATISRYINEAMNEGMIKPYDERASKKFMKYVPFWA